MKPQKGACLFYNCGLGVFGDDGGNTGKVLASSGISPVKLSKKTTILST